MLARDAGKKGESLAAHYLLEKGYDLLKRNYRSGRNEIDLIAQYRETLIFVEVKFRSSTRFGYPEDFVSDDQMERIREAAESYLEDPGWQGPIRFDIIAIDHASDPPDIVHFEDAFN